jgi:hypothetical protein
MLLFVILLLLRWFLSTFMKVALFWSTPYPKVKVDGAGVISRY